MRLAAAISILAILAAAPQAFAQGAANGIASPIQKVTPTGAVTIPQAEVPSVGTLDPVQPHWVFVNRGNGQDGTRIFELGLRNLGEPTGKRVLPVGEEGFALEYRGGQRLAVL